MTLSEFKATLASESPDPHLNKLLRALWWQANDQWDKAHDLVQNLDSSVAKWIHAMLHRQESDLDNSLYWYSDAGRELPDKSLQAEWEEIANFLLQD